MRVISLSQPWLWAVLHAGKHIENRSWMPPVELIGYRIALHGAKSFDDRAIGMFIRLGIDHPGRRDLYQTSAILGVATIDRVVSSSRTLTKDQARWFFETRDDGKENFGWILTDVRALMKPIPWRGAQGLRILPKEIVSQIDDQLSEAA